MNPPVNASGCKRHGFDPWVRKIPWRRAWQTHFTLLAWRIPWTEEPGGLHPIVSQRDRHDWSNWARTHALHRQMPCTNSSSISVASSASSGWNLGTPLCSLPLFSPPPPLISPSHSEFTATASALPHSLPSTNFFSTLIPDGFLLKCKSIHVTWLLKILQSFPLALRISSNSSERITGPGRPACPHPMISWSLATLTTSWSHSGATHAPASGFSWCFSLLLEWSSPLPILYPPPPPTHSSSS